MTYFLSNKTIIEAYKNLCTLQVKNPSILHIFLILKGCGYNNLSAEPLSLLIDHGLENALPISILFAPDENRPETHDFINPFSMKKWGTQEPTEPLKKWAPARIKNNIIGGATTWRQVLYLDPKNNQIKFSYDYIDVIKELTLQSQKINLIATAIWSNRFTSFDRKLTVNELINDFVNKYKLDTAEISSLFTKNLANLEIEFTKIPHNPNEIRKLIDPQAAIINWNLNFISNNEKSSQNIEFSYRLLKVITKGTKNMNKEAILNALTNYHQVLLSGPPATSKSYLADSLKGDFDKCTKIQFHPQYMYQDFIGGYVVNKTEVEYKKGLMLEILEYLENNPKHKYLLIIDEFNRANVSQVFGEVLQCLDRNYSTELRLDGKAKQIALPLNLYILATMNTSDRTLGSLDHAVKRRFFNIYCSPQPELLIDSCITPNDISLSDFLTKLNKRLFEVTKNKEFAVGQAIFFNEKFKQDGKYHWDMPELEELFYGKIYWTIEDFCYNDISKIEDVLGTTLMHRPTNDLFKSAFVDYTNS